MRSRVASVLATIVALSAVPAAQAPVPQPAPVDGRVRDLLVLLDARDEQSSADAARELAAIGPSVAPAVVEVLKKRNGCQLQWTGSAVLEQLKVEPEVVETALFALARGTCEVRAARDVYLLQYAANAIVDRPAGIRLLTGLLRGREPVERARAALAFDELIERLDAGHPKALPATPQLLEPMAAALPALRDVAASKDKPPTPCTAYEALRQAARLPHATVRDPAAKLLAGMKTDCATPSDARGTTSASRGTATAPRESLRELARRLDSVPPELAQQTTSALLAVGAEAVPVLEERLRESSRCRGLALAGGILAGQHAAPAAVEAAYIRVLEGKCAGREPFDLALAQGVADAFMREPAGVTRIAALFTHKEADVRRRAAQAFSKTFERLGSGEHGAAGANDAALVAPLTAALEPLVALATTERDETARCQAVRALLFANQAAHDGLRSAAAAATAGRTIRCLAPPVR